MREEDIVAKLKPVILPGPTPLPQDEVVSVDEQSSLVSNDVSELELLKLGNEFGIIHPNDDTTERLKFIHEQLSLLNMKGSYEGLLEVLDTALVRLGFKYKEDRFMRLYLWLKMNQEKQAIENEMAIL